jgi:drug/metabolite transporter (DMT)-like permease
MAQSLKDDYMFNLGLYTITIIIWGSTWIITKHQVSELSALHSVLFRYLLAAFLLQGILYVFKSKEQHAIKIHFLFFLLGSTLFCWNYVLFYLAASTGLTTGLIAVIFSTIITMNIANNAIIFRDFPQAGTVIGAMIGLLGIALVFFEDIQLFKETGLLSAIGLCLFATYLASLGNMFSKILQRKEVSVVSANKWGMTYGAISLLIATIFFDRNVHLPTTFPFLSGLLFLAIFGSIIGFWTYLTLLGRVGADKAAYAMIVFPIWSLMLSWFFEDFTWTPMKVIGVIIILTGNLFIVSKGNLNFRFGQNQNE